MNKIVSVKLLLSILVALSLFSCNRDSNIQVPVRDVDYVDKTVDAPKDSVVMEILGANRIFVRDTFLIATTNDAEGQLKVYSTNSWSLLGSFCKKGRARNEMIRFDVVPEQTYYKDNHFIVLVQAERSVFIEVDITESLEKGYTVVKNIEEVSSLKDGQIIFLDKDLNKRIEYKHLYYDPDSRDLPVRFFLVNNNKSKELKFFKSPMKTVEDMHKQTPYLGGIFKHPQRNMVVKMFTGMDYLLFMDFDSTDYYAVHQAGSLTFEGLYESEESFTPHFALSTTSNDFFMLTYFNGSYSIDAFKADNVLLPEIMVFDWKGNFLKGLKMKQFIKSMGYDELHKNLYVMDFEDKLHAYDFKKIIF
ncbi:MAG: hypothetical protein J5705_06680 [Bacteroidaceae bacterium]|nr:hypothetical protein [Bacteroidaceae bacterium]